MNTEKKPFKLSSSIKQYTYDQDKALDPQTTVKRTVEGLKKMFDLSNVDIKHRHDEIEGAYSFSSISDQLNASGKGLTPEQAQASAIMEFAERYSWQTFDYANYDGYCIKTYNQIVKEGIPTVPEDYFLYHMAEMKHRKEVTEVIKNIPLKWIKGVSLITNKKYYYPVNWHTLCLSSNGLASGNSMEEAIIQAMCEVIERENLFKLFVDKKIGNDVEQDGIDNKLIRRVLDNAKKRNLKFTIKDITYDLGVPTFIVYGVSEKLKGTMLYRGVGQGTHINPEKALIRSLAEFFESYSLLSKYRDEAPQLDKWMKYVPKGHYGFWPFYNPEMLNKKKKVIKLSDMPDLSKNDIKDEIEDLLKRFKDKGYDVVFVNLTNPKLGIPVCRIFIPRMRNLMNTDLKDIDFQISAVLHEAGKSEESLKYFKKFAFSKPFARIVIPEINKLKTSDKAFLGSKDYRDIIRYMHGYKKNALEFYKLLEKRLETLTRLRNKKD